LMYVSIAKHSSIDARVAGQTAVAHGFAKAAIVVDDDVDVYDQGEVLWATATRMNDVFTYSTNPDSNTLEEVSGLGNKGGRLSPVAAKLIIDATGPDEPAKPVRVVPPADIWKRIRLNDYLTK
ncbi:MAG: UbiD family decarboxylase, partial [Dehalococcoidia bacterium]|nr:UbiD family decarboxylase [Dehalococcoidia bacterium]